LNGFIVSGATRASTIIGNFQIAPGGFIAFFDNLGNCKWAKNYFKKTVAGITMGSINQLKTIGNKIFALGSYNNLDTITVDTIMLPIESNRYGALLLSLDSVGKIQWYKNFKSPNNNVWFSTLNSDYSNNLCLNIPFQSQLIIDETDTLLATDSTENVILKYTQNGFRTLTQSTGQLTPSEVLLMPDQKIIMLGNLNSSKQHCNKLIIPDAPDGIFISILDSMANCDTTFLFRVGSIVSSCIGLDRNIMIAGSAGKDVNAPNELMIGQIHLISIGFTDGFLAKFNGFTSGIDDRSKKVNTTNESLLIYANPSNGMCDVEIPEAFIHEKELILNIYSNTGVLIQQVKVDMSEAVIKVDIQEQAKGMYTATLSNGSKLYKGRIVFE
jgi:hypothetical protein